MRIAIGLALLAGAIVFASESVSVWDGVYVEAQSARGKALYGEQCADCHGANLKGETAPALAGEAFVNSWNGLSADDVFEYMKRSMPRGAAGSLSREQTADILAYMLTANGFPAGKKDLPSDITALQAIRIEAVKAR
jgi:S-disulfanyl-L-cysteine oxidoreductase SoxD